MTIILTACQSRLYEEVFRETQFLFDTEVYIEAYGKNAQLAGKEALKQMAIIDEVANVYSSESEMTKLNEAAGVHPINLSEDGYNLLYRALEMADMTEGLFDPTIGPLVKLWMEAKETMTLPRSIEIAKALKLVNYKNVILDSTNKSAFLPYSGMSIDLGSITKGYAVEQAVNILKEADITSAIVRAGGNVYTIGEKPDGSAWQVGIRNPLELDNVIGYVQLQDNVMDTSGDYEQYFELDGKRYTHIIDPRTGYPVEGTSSSTVVTNSPSLADALSTSLFILGKDESKTLFDNFSNLQWLIMSNNGEITMSAKMGNLLE